MNSATWIALWNESAAHWGETMWRACWQGGLCVLIVWMICRLWRGIPSTLRYGLWWLVCLKLLIGLCPILLSLPLLPPARSTAPHPELPLTRSLPQPIISALPATLAASPPSPSDVGREADRTVPPLSGAAWLLVCWLAGTGVLAGTTARSLYRLRQLRRLAQPLSEPPLLMIAQEAATAIGIRNLPHLLVTPVDVGVLTLGARDPAVLLSEQVLACCEPSELRLILAHEFAHLRRGDAWLGLVPQLAQLLFCFYPLAWLACRELELARETTCDEQTLYSLQARPDLYGRLLLKLGARRTGWYALCTPGISSHFRILHRRISMLQQITESTPRRLRGRVVLPVCFVGAALAAPWRIVHAQDPAQKPTAVTAQKQVSLTASEVPILLKSATAKDLAHILQQAFDSNHPTKPDKVTTALLQTKQIALRVEKPLPAAQKTPAHIKKATQPAAVLKPMSAKRLIVPTLYRPGAQRGDPEPLPRTTIFRLKYADAGTVATTLNTLFADIAGKTVKIVPDMRTNAILLQASEERSQEILQILQQLDDDISLKESRQNTFTRVIPLKYAQADNIATTLTTLFANGGETRIVPETRINVIVIQANEDKIQEILQILQQLDAPK